MVSIKFQKYFLKFYQKKFKNGVKFAELSSNLGSTILVQKLEFGGIKAHESSISHKFPQVFIFENESLSCNFFRNTNTDRGILGESWLPKQ